ncbi:hypothetical protein Godav_023668 [Gossypium davidsonii]|uniref:Uncharacterized protein n=1 Tax=Gossypium davidsonii TaxID=34287 RepID=A0A7J8ST12_GOSDV|nr:hypothetical protein [Gossypium davidsonii]
MKQSLIYSTDLIRVLHQSR